MTNQREKLLTSSQHIEPDSGKMPGRQMCSAKAMNDSFTSMRTYESCQIVELPYIRSHLSHSSQDSLRTASNRECINSDTDTFKGRCSRPGEKHSSNSIPQSMNRGATVTAHRVTQARCELALIAFPAQSQRSAVITARISDKRFKKHCLQC